jgi:protein TonB
MSLALHAGLALGASAWAFEVVSIPAKNHFRQGEAPVAMNVRLTLAPPSETLKESPTKADVVIPPAVPKPPAASQTPPSPPAAPPSTEFTGPPAPARPDQEQPGDAPGLSPNPKNTLATAGQPADSEASPKHDPPTTPAPDPPASQPPRPAAPVDPMPTMTAPPIPATVEPVQPAVAQAASRPVKSDDRTGTTSKPDPIAVDKPVIPDSPAPVPAAAPSRPTPTATASKAQEAQATPSPATTPGVARGIAIADLPTPRYPPLSVRAGEEGTVILEIEIAADGTVGEVRVIQSPGFPRLERAAIDAVRRARFDPAMRDGKAVGDRITKEFRFVLRDASGR